eukprot:9406684-Pyramimonas_sp.AAC.1
MEAEGFDAAISNVERFQMLQDRAAYGGIKPPSHPSHSPPTPSPPPSYRRPHYVTLFKFPPPSFSSSLVSAPSPAVNIDNHVAPVASTCCLLLRLPSFLA